ncbi:hypothetical protein [Nocardia panacis]|uniref:hypothetical protein n=1 Tax=Nocardia panacis TaxID=2340916 RepID=UPI0011C45ABE|nr:hypothetical protein [Nocardia panacis]
MRRSADGFADSARWRTSAFAPAMRGSADGFAGSVRWRTSAFAPAMRRSSGGTHAGPLGLIRSRSVVGVLVVRAAASSPVWQWIFPIGDV